MVWHVYHSSAHLPLLGTLTTAEVGKYDGTGCNSTPFFFAFYHTPIACDHLTCYHPHCGKLFTPILIDIKLVASYRIVQLPTVTYRAVLTMSRRTSIFTPHLICDCPCGRHHPPLHPNIVLITSFRCHPCRRHPHRHCTRRVILYNFPLSLRELR